MKVLFGSKYTLSGQTITILILYVNICDHDEVNRLFCYFNFKMEK